MDKGILRDKWVFDAELSDLLQIWYTSLFLLGASLLIFGDSLVNYKKGSVKN